MKERNRVGIILAVLSAILFAVNVPFSKLILAEMGSSLTAGILYLGAGIGMGILYLVTERYRKLPKLVSHNYLTLAGIISLDIVAAVLLMAGLSQASAANVSLLNNFEIVATALFAHFIFKEPVSGRLWAAIGFVTVAAMLLTLPEAGSLTFSPGSILILIACAAWGMENNLTHRLAGRDPLQIVALKGLGIGIGSIVIGLLLHETWGSLSVIALGLAVGFVCYGLSVDFYIRAQCYLGPAKTTTWYALSPFFGVGISIALYGTPVNPLFYLAAVVMMIGTYLNATDGRKKKQ